MHRGFITLHRKIIEWEWYSDTNVFRVFTHLILTANWEPKKWQGILVNRGQKVTSTQHIAEETGLTPQCVRTAINKLKLTGELTSKSTNKYTVVTLTNYDLYQKKENELTSNLTSETTNGQQTDNKQLTTTKQLNNITIKQKENNPFDFQSTGDDSCSPEKAHELELKNDKHKKDSKPNAWAIWVDINREFGRTDPFVSGKDTKAAKSILSQIQDPEKFKDILRQYLTDDDRFLIQNGHSISLLSSRINKYLNQSYKSMYDDEQGCDDAIIEAIEAECWAKNPELMKRQQEEYEETIARMKREREEKAEELRKLKEELI